MNPNEDTEHRLTVGEKQKLSDLVEAYEGKGGLGELAKAAKLSDLALARAGAGWKSQRGTISMIRSFLVAQPAT